MTTPDLSVAKTVVPEQAPVEDPPSPGVPGVSSESVDKAPKVTPIEAPVSSSLAGITKAGVELTRWVLGIIAAFLGLTLLITTCSEYRAATRSHSFTNTVAEAAVARRTLPYLSGADTAAVRRALDVARADSAATGGIMAQMALEQAAVRQFWLGIYQMVLLNVLLPVLTALLGYVFGSTKRE